MSLRGKKLKPLNKLLNVNIELSQAHYLIRKLISKKAGK